jgi:O-methyltransferase involved in polyketide biosynthesis
LRLNKPLVVVHEGILMYLDEAEQRLVRDNIRSFLRDHSPDGAWITTDFSERDLDQGLLQRLMTHLLVRRVRRPFNRFPNVDSVGRFLSAADLAFELLPSPNANDSDPSARALAESFRAWRISLAKR